MRALAAALAVLLVDSSWIRIVSDPSKFEPLRTFTLDKPNSVSPAGNAFAIHTANVVTLVEVKPDGGRRTLMGHDSNLHDPGWSPDGRLLATAGYDGTVRVWDVATGACLTRVASHTGYS